MFSKGKSALKLLENNPILNHYEVGRLYASGGPEGVWKIHEGFSKADGKEVSIFVFDKKSVDKLHKPKRKEAMTELLKKGLGHLQCYRHPKLLLVLHGPDESSDSLAFASEPLIGSLANILSAENPASNSGSFDFAQDQKFPISINNSMLRIDYSLIDVEHRYGFSQVTKKTF